MYLKTRQCVWGEPAFDGMSVREVVAVLALLGVDERSSLVCLSEIYDF